MRSPDGRTPQQALAEIRERVLELTRAQARLWSRELRPALAAEGIVVGGVEDCTDKELAELDRAFRARDLPGADAARASGPGQPFPYISPLSLCLGVFVRDPDTGEERFARVKVPGGHAALHDGRAARAVRPARARDRHFLPALFPQMELIERALFRVTRDADFEVSDEADDLLEAVELELRRRRFGDVVRLEVSSQMSSAMLDRLKLGLDVDDAHVYQVGGLLDLSELAQLLRARAPRPA